ERRTGGREGPVDGYRLVRPRRRREQLDAVHFGSAKSTGRITQNPAIHFDRSGSGLPVYWNGGERAVQQRSGQNHGYRGHEFERDRFLTERGTSNRPGYRKTRSPPRSRLLSSGGGDRYGGKLLINTSAAAKRFCCCAELNDTFDRRAAVQTVG